MRWPTGKQIAWFTVLASIFVVWTAAVQTTEIPSQCAGRDCASKQTCRYLLVLRHWIEWSAETVRSNDNDKVVVAYSAAFTAVFTLVLAAWTIRLWGATERLAADSERTTALLERPWLTVTKAEEWGIGRPTHNGKVRVKFELKNSGRSVALLRQLRGGGKASAPEVDISSIRLNPLPISDVIGSAIAPGGDAFVEVFLKEAVPKESAEKIAAGNASFVIRAVLEYTGPLRESYKLAFCVRYDPESRGLIGHGGEEHSYTT